MPKKKKKFNKFKKKHPGQRPQPVASQINQSSADTKEEAIVFSPDEPESSEEKIAAPQEETDVPEAIENEYAHVKKDVKKILIIMLLIILLLVIIYIVSLKTALLSSLGDWVYKLLNIYNG